MSRGFEISNRSFRPWQRWAIFWSVLAVAGLIVFLLTWNSFFEYVPPGKHLIITANDGDPLPEGQVLAVEGQKGIRAEVLGEGWHFVLPIVYSTKLGENTVIPAGKAGVITARGGKKLPPGRFLAEPGEQGIQRTVLTPGVYRINRHGYDVELVEATNIRPGYVGVLRRLLGRPAQGRFADKPDEQGILREILQPGLYYINPKEFAVIPAEIGIIQTSFHYDPRPGQDTSISFTSKGGFPISLDCTVEWEILPENMPMLVAEYGSWREIERNVIDVQAKTIGRDKGYDYSAQDFLEGAKREKFQADFTQELERVCKEKNVTIHSAFIRTIKIPEEYLRPIREKQVAAETEETNKAKQATADTEAMVETEQRIIKQKVAEVESETKRLVAQIDQEVKNVKDTTQFEIDLMKADYAGKIAALNAERLKVEADAENEVKRLKETAKSDLYRLKMEVFQNDANAFLRYTLAEQINPNIVIRLFHAGPGTFWTNMDGKGMNLLLPTPGAAGAPPSPREGKDKKE